MGESKEVIEVEIEKGKEKKLMVLVYIGREIIKNKEIIVKWMKKVKGGKIIGEDFNARAWRAGGGWNEKGEREKLGNLWMR